MAPHGFPIPQTLRCLRPFILSVTMTGKDEKRISFTAAGAYYSPARTHAMFPYLLVAVLLLVFLVWLFWPRSDFVIRVYFLR